MFHVEHWKLDAMIYSNSAGAFVTVWVPFVSEPNINRRIDAILGVPGAAADPCSPRAAVCG
jgi:hypothetical protein